MACQNEAEPNTPWHDFNTSTFILFDVTAICFSPPSHYFPSRNLWSCFPKRMAEIVGTCTLLVFRNLVYSVDSKVYPSWGIHLFQIITKHYFKISQTNGHSEKLCFTVFNIFAPYFAWLQDVIYVLDSCFTDSLLL